MHTVGVFWWIYTSSARQYRSWIINKCLIIVLIILRVREKKTRDSWLTLFGKLYTCIGACMLYSNLCSDHGKQKNRQTPHKNQGKYQKSSNQKQYTIHNTKRTPAHQFHWIRLMEAESSISRSWHHLSQTCLPIHNHVRLEQSIWLVRRIRMVWLRSSVPNVIHATRRYASQLASNLVELVLDTDGRPM